MEVKRERKSQYDRRYTLRSVSCPQSFGTSLFPRPRNGLGTDRGTSFDVLLLQQDVTRRARTRKGAVGWEGTTEW